MAEYMQKREPTGYYGVDISSWQEVNDPEKLFQNSPHFIYFRAYGSDHSSGGDVDFVRNVNWAKQYGVPSGAYYFATPRKPIATGTIQSEAREEADQFIAKLQEAYGQGRYGDLIPMLDVEAYTDLRTDTPNYPMASGMTAAELLEWILEFRDYFWQQTKRALGFYSNRYFMQDATQMGMTTAQVTQLNHMPLWLAEYDRFYPNNPSTGPTQWAGWGKYNLWQWEILDNAADYGIAPGELDHNYTDDLERIKPTPQAQNTTIIQKDNTTITVYFSEPTTSNYIGSDIYVNGVWSAWCPKGVTSKEITVSTPIGEQLSVYVSTQNIWQDITKGPTIYHTMADVEAPGPPTIPTEPSYVYSEQEIRDMLHFKKGSRDIRFRYVLLDRNENRIRELDNVLSGEISMNAFNTIRRTAKFTLRENPERPINYLSDRIQPFIDIRMPDKWVQDSEGIRQLVPGKWIEYSMGIFILSSPTKKETGEYVYRDVEAYDKTVILEEDKYVNRMRFLKGTGYVQAITIVLQSAGITKYNIQPNDKILSSDIEYEPGTPKSKPIADFLNAINYRPLWVDEFGYFRSEPYISPQDKDPDYRYEVDEFSVISVGMEEELDLYSVPNSWVAYSSNADLVDDPSEEIMLRSSYTNTNPDSPTSTVSRGRTIVDFRKVEEIADQAALDAYVERIAFQSSQIFGKVKFTTAIMPFHGFQNVLYLRNDTLGIDGKYSETAWNIKMEAGALMTHEARKIVQI